MTTTKLDMLELYEMSMEEMKENNGGQEKFEDIVITGSNYRPHIANAISGASVGNAVNFLSYFTIPTLIGKLIPKR